MSRVKSPPGGGGQGIPRILGALIPKANPKGGLSRGPGSRSPSFAAGLCHLACPGRSLETLPLFWLSFPIVPGAVDAELRKRALCVDAAPAPSPGGRGRGLRAASTRGRPAGWRGLTWQSTIILSLRSSSPAPGRARGSQRPFASARARRRGASGCGAHGAASRPRRARGSAAVAVAASAAPIVCACRAAGRSGPALGSARAPGAPAGWAGTAGTARPRPGPAPAVAGARRGPARELGGALGLSASDARGWTPRCASSLASTAWRALGACAGPRAARARDPASRRARVMHRVLGLAGLTCPSALAAFAVPQPSAT
ncbi:uncharacterized protein LOC144377400 [Ictidomys tridecemlineatus]